MTIERDPIFIKDGNCYTSAGVTAGIDLALALVEEDLGREVALRAAQMMVCFSDARVANRSSPLHSLRRRLKETLWQTYSRGCRNTSLRTCRSKQWLVCAMSPRNFSRAFEQAVGSTPALHLEALRVEAARRLLETSSLSQAEIAGRIGVNNTETLRRIFGRHLHVTPGAYRKSSANKRLHVSGLHPLKSSIGDLASSETPERSRLESVAKDKARVFD